MHIVRALTTHWTTPVTLIAPLVEDMLTFRGEKILELLSE